MLRFKIQKRKIWKCKKIHLTNLRKVVKVVKKILVKAS